MKTSLNIIALPLNLEELLFTNKNREYGSYILRKSYKKYLMTACAVAILLSCIGTTWPLFIKEHKTGKEHIIDYGSIDMINTPTIENDNPVEIFRVTPSAIKTVKFTVPKIVEDDKVMESIPTVEDLLNVQPWTKTQDPEIGGYDPTLNFTEPTKTADAEPPMTPVTWVPEMPHYPGGEEALQAFISSNIKYPELARKAGIQGRVVTSFTIERNGAISDIKIEKGIGGGCDEEAQRVIALLEKWDPGKQNGNPVRVRMMIPINFKLQ